MAGNRFPTTQEVKSAMETAGTTIDGAEYLASRVRDLATKSKFLSKNPELKENIIAAVDKFADYVRFKLTVNGQPWSGQQLETSDLKNMQNNLADAAVREMAGKVSDIKVDYAVSAGGHYVRGYSSSDGAVPPETVGTLDKVFNAWLASKDHVIKGGFIYHIDDKVQNESTRISQDEIQKLMDEGGLKDYMANKGITIQTRERNYPGEEKAAEVAKDAEHAVEVVAKVNAEEGLEGPEADTGPGVSAH
ncbi:hypothetical protein J2N86_01270 [Legionella lytica]|uniref:Substrate of the Dot/Icm secretion system n=1 Tax=Legionella lytica TaxID=96232 RepID=A0ABY4Y8R5_9GAMM|nr:hypothetical protein [Legionella lytica]USQ14006.1 hypothetical protein J2N86_01270 [Legionella lytica]